MKDSLDSSQLGAVAIALAMYNGSEFLPSQLESIKQQNYSDWTLYVRDDCSDDNSCEIVKNFVNKNEQIHIISDKKGNLGSCGNFSYLLQASELLSSNYIALADQDDVWVHDKLSCQMDLMRKMEIRYPDSPVLVHSDMKVVDASLNVIAPSFMNYVGIKHEDNALAILLAQNFVTGCTTLVNRRLLDIALPIPENAILHDWWLALCAVVFGHIGYINKPLVKYRQHANNEVGTKRFREFLNPFSVKWKEAWKEGRENLFQSMKQAQALADRIRKHDPSNFSLPLIESYASLSHEPSLKRISHLYHTGVHMQSKNRQALLLARLLLTPKI